MLRIVLSALLMLPALAVAADYKKHFSVANKVAKAEGEPWVDEYSSAVKDFERGEDASSAIAEFNYLGFEGSVASSIRLCVIYAYGVESKVNPIAGLFWCGKAYEAGYKAANSIRRELFIKHWPEYEG